MNSVVFFLVRNKLLLLSIVLLTVVSIESILLTYYYGKTNTLTVQNEVVSLKLEIAESSVTQLKSSIEEQNSAINMLKIKADEQQKINKINIDQARNQALTFKKKAEELMNRRPIENESICKSAESLINEMLFNEK